MVVVKVNRLPTHAVEVVLARLDNQRHVRQVGVRVTVPLKMVVRLKREQIEVPEFAEWCLYSELIEIEKKFVA